MIKLKEVAEKYGERYIDEEKLEGIFIKPKGRIKPEYGDVYFYIIVDGNIKSVPWTDNEFDNRQFKMHNCFETLEDAKIALAIQNYCVDNSFEPDWYNHSQLKYFLQSDKDYWSHRVAEVTCYGSNYYFPTKEKTQGLIDRFGYENLKKFYFNIY